MSCIIAENLIIEGASNFSITPNEAAIVVCEPLEASQLCNHDGNGPVFDSLYLTTIGLDAFI